MKNKLFREKSLERITSPEQLNERIRVANPSVWLLLLGVILVLIGVCIWGVFGRLDTLLPVGAATENGSTVCYVSEADIDRVNTGMTVLVEEAEYAIRSIASQPVQVDADFPAYLCHIGGLTAGDWVHEITLDPVPGTEGSVFRAEIVIERIAPAHFVIN